MTIGSRSAAATWPTNKLVVAINAAAAAPNPKVFIIASLNVPMKLFADKNLVMRGQGEDVGESPLVQLECERVTSHLR